MTFGSLALLLALVPLHGGPPVRNVTAIVGATIIDGTGAPSIEDAAVIIDGERILAVGHRTTTPIPQGATVVKANGKWIIPGLIDMHVHLDEVIVDPGRPGQFLRYGVTSVRDVGSRLVTIQKWRAKTTQNRYAPRIFWMGRNIDEGQPSWWGAVAVKSAAEVPDLLSDMARQGVDGVKLYVNAGPRVTGAVIREAHLRGWPVTAHLDKTLPSQAARMGIDNLEHVSQLFIELKPKSAHAGSGFGAGFTNVSKVDLNSKKARDLVALLARSHVAVTPTLTVSLLPVLGGEGSRGYYSGWSPADSAWKREWARSYWSFITPIRWPQSQYQEAAEAFQKYKQMVGDLYRAGVPLVAGTDTPAPWVQPGAGLLVELQLMVEAGVPPGEAIKAATGRAAEILRRDDDVGAIVPGRYADLVVLNANPFSNIRNLHQIHEVYQNGVLRWHEGDYR